METSLQVMRITLCALVVVSSPLILMIIKNYLDKLRDDKLRYIVQTYVEAAEQLLKEIDSTGEKRLQFVLDSLQKMGIPNNDYVRALIEQMVLNIF
jgi:hypothetical protein